MPSIMTYEVHSNLASPSAFIDKLKDFAITCGWTLFEQYKDLAWSFSGGSYGFNSASAGENYIELHTTDYGGNTLKYRIKCRNTASASSDNIFIDAGLHKYTADADKWNTASGDHPYIRSKNEASIWYDTFACKATNIPTVWFFGNSKVLYWVIKYDATYCDTFGTGILEMLDTTEGLGWWMYDDNQSAPIWSLKSLNYNGLVLQKIRPGTSINDMAHSTSAGWVRKDWYFVKNTVSTAGSSQFYGAEKLMNNNPFSSIKPAFQNYFFYNENGAGIWRPYAKNWHVHLNTYGLLIGEQIKYGNEKYITFPYFTQNVDYMGHAFRIE